MGCYLLSFAWQDLRDRYALRTTLVIVSTIAFICAFTLASYGFLFGVEQVKLHRLDQDKLARCLWTGDNIVRQRITPAVRAELEARIRQKLSNAGDLEGVFPFREVKFDWRTKDQLTIPLRGRTLAVDDPLLQGRRPVRPGGRIIQGPDDRGIVIAPSMLKALGWLSQSAPESLHLVATGNVVVSVPVLGVLEENLPLVHDFIIPERYAHELESQNPDPELQLVYSGPVPDDWPTELAMLPEVVRKMFQTYRLAPPIRVRGRDGLWVWSLESQGAPGDREKPLPTLSEWYQNLRRIHAAMTPKYTANEAFITQLDTRGQVPPPPPLPVAHDMAGIYIRDLKQLAQAVTACESVQAGEENLKVANKDIVKQVEALLEDLEMAVKVLIGIGVLLLIVAIWNIWVIQELRSEQKVAEIGMLKAIGMSGPQLLGLCLIEGGLLWAFGAAGGLLVGLGGGWTGAWLLHSDPKERQLGFASSAGLIVAVVVGSGVISLLGSWYSSWTARKASASESLRSN